VCKPFELWMGFLISVHLFEYDKRFAAFGSSYIFYDYSSPESVPEQCFNAYSVVIVDPPFLAKECLEKVAETVKKISKPDAKIILCTGAFTYYTYIWMEGPMTHHHGSWWDVSLFRISCRANPC